MPTEASGDQGPPQRLNRPRTVVVLADLEDRARVRKHRPTRSEEVVADIRKFTRTLCLVTAV